MAMRSLSIAATGASALQNQIDVIANNIANVNTGAFKRTRANFADLLYQQVSQPGFGTAGENQNPTGLSFGTGVRTVSTEKIFSQGTLKKTDRDLDLAIEGDGFFKITLPNSTVAYTRAGNFNIDQDGTLVTTQGFKLDPEITVDQAIVGISVDETGLVQGFDPQDSTNLVQIGQLQLSRFINPSGLQAIGDNLFIETPASGNAQDGDPDTESFGKVRQGFLEESNVDVVRELVNLITAQRAFEINTNSIQASDEILQSVNNLRR